MRELPSYWNHYKGGRYKLSTKWTPGLPRRLSEITQADAYPSDFHIHPKVKKLLEQRAEMGTGKRPVDYGMAEALASAGLVRRHSGSADRAGHARGTFNQRHAVLVDTRTRRVYAARAPLRRPGALRNL